MITCKDYKCLTKFLSLFLQYKMVKISATEILPHKVILPYQKKKYMDQLGLYRITYFRSEYILLHWG